MIFILEIKFQKYTFLAIYEDFCRRKYVRTNVSSQNKKQAIGIQVTFILEIKSQRYIF